MADPIRDAAEAFLQAYAEHLNNHCARCTEAYARLRAALEASPEPPIPVLTSKIPPGTFRAPSR